MLLPSMNLWNWAASDIPEPKDCPVQAKYQGVDSVAFWDVLS